MIKYITVSVLQNAEIFLGTAADYDVTVVRLVYVPLQHRANHINNYGRLNC